MTEPPFPHYDKPAGPIEAHATKLAHIGERYAAQSLRIRRNHCDAVSVTSGILFQPISRAADPPAAHAAALGQQALVHSGATKLWAAAIETFNRGVDKLNQEWASAQATSFGITEPVPHGNAEVVNREFDRYSHQVAAAKRAEIADLQRRYEHLKERLHDTAVGVHNLYRADPGDYQQIIAAMVGAGLLPNSLTTPAPNGDPAPLPSSMAAIDPCLRGNNFEGNVLKDLEVDKNTTIYDVIKNADGTFQVVTRKPFAPRGLLNFMFKRGTIPDGVTATHLIEIKDLTRLLRPTSQIRQQIELAIRTGKKYTLIFGPDSPGLAPELKHLLERMEEDEGLKYEVKQAASRGDSGAGTSPTWGKGGRPDVGGRHDPDDPGVQPPFCGPDDDDPPAPDPKPVPVPVPEPEPEPEPEPHGGGFWGDVLGVGLVVVGVGSKVVAVAGAPETGGASLGLLAVP